MSDTPETHDFDQLIVKLRSYSYGCSDGWLRTNEAESVLVDAVRLARRLERERDAARSEVAKLQHQLGRMAEDDGLERKQSCRFATG